MIEFAKVKRPKKFGVGHSTTENTEDTEKENNLAGGFSPRPPISQKTKNPRGSRGETPSPAAFLSVPSVFSVVEGPIPKFFYPLFMSSMVESTVIPKWHVLNRASMFNVQCSMFNEMRHRSIVSMIYKTGVLRGRGSLRQHFRHLCLRLRRGFLLRERQKVSTLLRET